MPWILPLLVQLGALKRSFRGLTYPIRTCDIYPESLDRNETVFETAILSHSVRLSIEIVETSLMRGL